MHLAVHCNRTGKNQRGFYMTEIESIVLKNVQLFLDKLRRTGFHISKAYIFGSYAKGQVKGVATNRLTY